MIDVPLVSVVTPAYSVAPWIGQAMDSVLSQTESRLEYVVVDDGSTDDTAAIVAERAARDPRLRLIRTDNGGSGRARNIGLTATLRAVRRVPRRRRPLAPGLPAHRAHDVRQGAAAGRCHVQPHTRDAGERTAGRDALAARRALRPRPAARRPQPAAQRQFAGAAAVAASKRWARSTRACAAASTSTCGCASRPSRPRRCSWGSAAGTSTCASCAPARSAATARGATGRSRRSSPSTRR